MMEVEIRRFIGNTLGWLVVLGLPLSLIYL